VLRRQERKLNAKKSRKKEGDSMLFISMIVAKLSREGQANGERLDSRVRDLDRWTGGES